MSDALDHRSELAFQVCEAYYMADQSQKEVAQRFGISSATVSRLLRFGRESGIVKVSLNPPQDVELTRRLEKHLAKFGVRSTAVCSAGFHAVGHAAARFFEMTVKSDCTVVLDGGQTVGAFVESISNHLLPSMTIVPVTADPPSYEHSAYMLMTRMAARSPNAVCLKLPYARSDWLDAARSRACEAARNADFVFMGGGPWSTGFTAIEFIRHLGLDPEAPQHRHPEVAAVVAYLAISGKGDFVEIPEMESMHIVFSLSELQKLAQSPANVVLLAASKQKADAILAVLKARVCNVCIFDELLSNELLRRLESEA